MGVMKRGRTLAAGLVVGALIGTGVAAVTPAGAAVKSAAASIDWKQVWKQEIKPRAKKTFYTKRAANQRYYTKAAADGLFETKAAHDASLANYYTKAQSDANYYTKAQSDAKYAPAGSSYSKAESDAKYAPLPGLIRGTFILLENNDTFTTGDISFGYTLASAPVVTIIPTGGPATAACPGTVANPLATAGNLCIYLRFNSSTTFSTTNATLGAGASPFGAFLLASRAAAGYLEVSGSWAVRPPATGLSPTVSAKEPSVSGPAIGR